MTELLDATGEQIREAGAEFGTTTGRPRRCGWLDIPILRYAARINGLDEFALTKLDVLSGIGPLRVAVAYEREGERVDFFPAEFGIDELAKWKPVYADLPGWEGDITGLRQRGDLPSEAQDYAAFLEEQSGIPVTFIGVGPARDQSIV